MGIVVSGENKSPGASKERQKIKSLVAENDWGLAMATLDQITTFVASWWTNSLSSRIQVGREIDFLIVGSLTISRLSRDIPICLSQMSFVQSEQALEHLVFTLLGFLRG